MRKVAYIIPVLLASTLLAGHVFPLWKSYHDFEGKCLNCHLSTPGEGDEEETELVFMMDITTQCTNCHKNLEQLSHPVDMKPSMKMPADFPLDWKGQVSCVTCHTAHKETPGDIHLRSAARGAGFCTLCHYDIETKAHRTLGEAAHITAVTGSRYRFLAGELDTTLDALSLRCLACHDAVFGVDAMIEERRTMKLYHSGSEIALSHPIGVSYQMTRSEYGAAYRDIKDLPPEIKLFGGMVGCGSCHNPYSKEHSELVVSNRGSGLCLACHVK